MRKSAPLFCALLLSLSARRAWIEIFVPFDVIRPAIVALRKESVDRNATTLLVYLALIRVALRKESVDRNIGRLLKCCFVILSLSARRAWIEMLIFGFWTAQSRRRSPQGERG